jgi:hypothetical protein
MTLELDATEIYQSFYMEALADTTSDTRHRLIHSNCSSGLYFDLFCADLAQLGIHLVEVAIYELSTQSIPHLWFML